MVAHRWGREHEWGIPNGYKSVHRPNESCPRDLIARPKVGDYRHCFWAQNGLMQSVSSVTSAPFINENLYCDTNALAKMS